MIDCGLRHLFVTSIRNALVVALLGCGLTLPSHAGTTKYGYDALGRLTTVKAPDGTDQSVTTYTYDAAGNRASVVASIVDMTPPNAPTGLTATAEASDDIRLNWTPSLDIGGAPASYYKVYRDGNYVASPNGPPFDDYPLNSDTTYSYTVSAVDAANNESPQSASASATTPPAPDNTPPSVPSSLQATAVSGTIVNLMWGASQDNPGGKGLAGYEIFRGSAQIGTSTNTSYSDQTAISAATYSYKVRAYDKAGNRSSFSNLVSVTTPDTVPPSAPGNPSFSAITATTATASWTAANDNVGVTRYRYSLNSGSNWTNVGNVLSTNVTGLAGNTTYVMLVQAGDAAGNWGPSSSNSFTTSLYVDSMSYVGNAESVDNYNALQTGYIQGGLFGSLTPDTTSNGKTIVAFTAYVNFYNPSEDYVYLSVSGFGSNPGADWLQSASGPGNLTFTGASASLNCLSGTCTWSWFRAADLRGPATLTIVHR